MLSKLKYGLLRFFHPLFHLFRMSATPPAQPEVSSLAELLGPNLHSNVGAFEIYILLALASQQPTWRGYLLVKEVFLVKQFSKRSEHEYFVAHVKLPDNTSRYISLERSGSLPDYDPPHPLNRLGRWLSRSDTSLPDRPGHSCADPPLPIDHNSDGLLDLNTLSVPPNESTIRQVGPGKHCSSASASSSWSSSRSSSTGVASLDSLSPPREALDIVSGHLKPTQEADDVVIGTLCLDSTPVYLHELAVLANTIHNSNRCYLLFSVNCYWFAGMLMNVLEKRINLEMKQVDRSPKRMFMGMEIKSLKKQGKNGNWTFVKVYKQAPLETVEAVLAEFEKNLSEFEKKIDEKRRASDFENDLRLREAERGREEAERAKEGAERAREEAERAREEAERERLAEREEAERERLAEREEAERERLAEREEAEKERLAEREEAEREKLAGLERERILLEKLAFLQRAD